MNALTACAERGAQPWGYPHLTPYEDQHFRDWPRLWRAELEAKFLAAGVAERLLDPIRRAIEIDAVTMESTRPGIRWVTRELRCLLLLVGVLLLVRSAAAQTVTW